MDAANPELTLSEVVDGTPNPATLGDEDFLRGGSGLPEQSVGDDSSGGRIAGAVEKAREEINKIEGQIIEIKTEEEANARGIPADVTIAATFSGNLVVVYPRLAGLNLSAAHCRTPSSGTPLEFEGLS